MIFSGLFRKLCPPERSGMGGFSIGRVDREIDVLADGRQVQLRVGDGAAIRVVKALAQLGAAVDDDPLGRAAADPHMAAVKRQLGDLGPVVA